MKFFIKHMNGAGWAFSALLLAVVLVVCGCSERESTQAKGYVVAVPSLDDAVFPVLRSTNAPSDNEKIALEFYQGDVKVASVNDFRETISSPVSIPVRETRVVAKSATEKDAAWNSPAYYGETYIEPRENQTVVAEVICSISNVLVTAEFSSDITQNFSQWELKVDNGACSPLTFSKSAGNLADTAYFKATGTLHWKLSVTNNSGQQYKDIEGTYNNVQAQDHYHLSFSLQEGQNPDGAGALMLRLDDSLIDRVYNLALDFSTLENPLLYATGFDVESGDLTHSYGDTRTYGISFKASNGASNVIIGHSDINLYAAGVPYRTDIARAQAADLAALRQGGITASAVSYGATEGSADFTNMIAALPLGDYRLTFAVYDIKGQMSSVDINILVKPGTETEIKSVSPWAKFAVLTGKWFEGSRPNGIKFQYREKGATAWTDATSEIIYNDNAKSFSTDLTGLKANTTYQVRTVSERDSDTRVEQFTTESAGTIYNLSFDDWYQSGKVWYPYAQNATASQKIWDSANPGSATYVGSATTPETSNVVKGTAARMESKYAVVAFAAGNMYTGTFVKVNLSPQGAELDWGVPFTSRPVALKGYMKYIPGTINRTSSAYSNMKGTTDKCQIVVLLTDWDKQFHVNTSSGIFVDYQNDSHIIAMGKLETDKTFSQYEAFTIPLEYRDITRTPKYAVIVTCSSYLGDYFTGAEGSVLYVDEFSFEYDISNLTSAEKSKVHYK